MGNGFRPFPFSFTESMSNTYKLTAETTDKEINRFLHLLLDMAAAMMACGCEVKRVEDTITRIGLAYGAQEMNVLVITASIIVTMVVPGDQDYTMSRRLRDSANDLRKIERYNELSRAICAAPVPTEAFAEKLEAIRSEEYPISTQYLGAVLAVAAYTAFFGGCIADMCVAAVFAVLTVILQKRLKPLCPNTISFNVLCCMIIGLGTCLCTRLLPILTLGHIMTGYIMLLIPGLGFTNSIRDILVGDTLSGILRIAEYMLAAGALAAGFMLAIWTMGVIV